MAKASQFKTLLNPSERNCLAKDEKATTFPPQRQNTANGRAPRISPVLKQPFIGGMIQPSFKPNQIGTFPNY